MATLEMVPLRRTLPTGRVTLRFPQPPLNPSVDLAALLLSEQDGEAAQTTTSTTPKVAVTAHRADETGETSARKGGEAR